MGRHSKQQYDSFDTDSLLPTGTRPTGGEWALGGRAERRKALRRIKRRRRRSTIKEVPILIGVALLIALGLKTFLVQAFVIPSGSMEQTIQIGDRVLVDKLTPWFGSEPERGDVVVFRDPGGWLDQPTEPPQEEPILIKQAKEGLVAIGLLPSETDRDLIKRLIAVGGDTVKCCDPNGRIMVNGMPLTEPYVHPGNQPSTVQFEVSVPPGRVFVMGDHRSNSADSRFHLREEGSGTVPEEMVVGRAVVIAWPFKHWAQLERRDTFVSVPDTPGAIVPPGTQVPPNVPPGTGTPSPGVGVPSPGVGVPPDTGVPPATTFVPEFSDTYMSADTVFSQEMQGLVPLPTPAALPLVRGVMGLRRKQVRWQRE